ncbi:hypothetical protein Cni_G22118 [Canna indica]|uniref:Uncharacterized protein n=1 Tax=Canna indica TaxID=4628 RepID=A0AAQ3QKX4_9LILI|nr:hypothetical protein Cni_G22118 [Canna indica]
MKLVWTTLGAPSGIRYQTNVFSKQRSFTTSNFSVAFPYVSIDEHETLESSIVKGFAENCGQGLGVDRVAYLDFCSVDGMNLEKLQGLHSVHGALDGGLDVPHSDKRFAGFKKDEKQLECP